MPALKFSGPVLPDGGARDLYVVQGRVTYEPVAGAESVASGWIVPGLVDAHNHLGLDDGGAVGDDEIEQQAIADRDTGVLLTRDCGSPADTRWVQEREDLPRLVRCGWHLARTKRYIRNYALEVEPDELASYAAQEARRADGWIKLVGDWISREEGDLAPSFPAATFREAIDAAHAEGAKVTAHCFGHEVLQGLLDAGIDCIEHGTGLAVEQVEQMAAAGVALVPTVMQTEKISELATASRHKYPAYAATMDELYAQRREVLMSAWEAGVQLYVGSDGGGVSRHGELAGEVLAMHEMGIPAADVLAAVSWRAREWLGFDGLGEGAEADFVVYPRDPAADLSVLHEPTCVVLRGRVVGG